MDKDSNINRKEKEIDDSSTASSSHYTNYSLAGGKDQDDEEGDDDLDFKLDEDVLRPTSRSAVAAGKKARNPSINTQRNLDIGQHQWQYNDCRLTLARSITSVLHLLQVLLDCSSTNYPTHITDPHSYKVLRLDFKDNGSTSSLVENLNDKAVSSLLNAKIRHVIKHLLSLRERIEDTSSKVLVTGDLNAGKSTLCNALLRQPLLTSDQQPCTNLFCEVLDARANNGVEECHAVIKGHDYDWKNELTYHKFPLDKISDIVERNDLYSLLKVYIVDKRPLDQSLLRNGVCDIALIDAPGLNIDSIHTTAVFARQEEIDVVVFVVNAENHFTQSAKEFIQTASKEKAYIFIVVNKFDTIRNKDKCRRLIMDQLDQLAPSTKQDAKNLVHFVNSEQSVPFFHNDGGDGDGDDGDPGPSSSHNRHAHNDPDFDRLEACLRNFVLEKRSLSKLAPVKTYLYNLLIDLTALASLNLDIASNNMGSLDLQLKGLDQQVKQVEKSNQDVSQELDDNIQQTTRKVYNYCKSHLTESIDKILSSGCATVPYRGIVSCLQYACEVQDAIVDNIGGSVVECEDYARNETCRSFNTIKSIGLQQFGDSYVEKVFQSHLMFTRKRDMLARNLEIDLSLGDFVDFYEQYYTNGAGVKGKASTTAALTLATVAGGGQLLSLSSIMSPSQMLIHACQLVGIKNVHKLILPGLGLALLAVVGYAIYDIPNAISRRIGLKIRTQLTQMDYIGLNSQRISNECQKVLGYPTSEIQTHFQRKIDSINTQLIEARSKQHDTCAAKDTYNTLLQDSLQQLNLVESIDLESLVN